MAKVLQVIDVDSDGHRIRLDDGRIIIMPHGGDHPQVGQEFAEVETEEVKAPTIEPQPVSEYLTEPLALAVLFHVTYERLAPGSGYETRQETRIFDPESLNGKLMLATCAEVQKAIRVDGGEPDGEPKSTEP